MHVCYIYFSLFLFLSLLFFFFSLNFLILDISFFVEYEFLLINSSLILMTAYFDWMTFMFMSFVMFISSMVVLYSKEYMGGDQFIKRFILLVVMFVVSMMLLIISPNLISILLGWDGLGLVSYCLVVYYQNIKSFNAGMLTALTNRLGDVGILLSIAWMLNFGSWSYIFYLDFYKSSLSMGWVAFLIIFASITKSAQIPFSSWLPAAMAAPTPVSSLVHSSTLVTAGVYLLIRFNFVLGENMMFFMLFISSMTMFMSGIGANFEFDLKKIIALSTLSQLGLMMSILFMGDYLLSFFHLLTHALFKALLFMCAGCMIHGLNNCQDIRYMGSLMMSMPLTCLYFSISSLSLCGIPFLSGFYSKDLIAEILSMSYFNIYIYLIFYMSIGLTVSYSMRLVYYTCMGNFNFISLNFLGDGKEMLWGMTGLIFLVIFMGSMLSWLIFPTPYIIFLPFYMKMLTLIFILVGSWMGLEMSRMYISWESLSFQSKNLVFFISSMWYMPYISTYGLNFYPLMLGNFYFKTLDLGWSEFYGSQKIFFSLKKFSIFLQFLFFNNLKVYFVLMLLWVLFLMMI